MQRCAYSDEPEVKSNPPFARLVSGLSRDGLVEVLLAKLPNLRFKATRLCHFFCQLFEAGKAFLAR